MLVEMISLKFEARQVFNVCQKNGILEIYKKWLHPSFKLGILYTIETNNKNSKNDSTDPTWKDWWILQILSPLEFRKGGGWTNPFEKYVRPIGSFPQSSGWTQKKYLKPPPRFHVSSTKQMTLDFLLEIRFANL